MSGRSVRIRSLRIVLVSLLVICVVQVVQWITAERRYTRRVLEQLVTTDERYADLAVELDRRRTTRYLVEGGVSLGVLAAGMVVLAHAVKQDAGVRRRQENFLAAVSHELKSPLAGMRLSAETLILRDPPPARRDELLERLLAELGRLERTVFNLLDSNLFDEQRMDPAPERVALAPLVASMVREYGSRTPEETLRLVSEIPVDIEVHADPVAVRTVVGNLIDNAVKATAHREGSHVRISATRNGREVRFEVADNGVGFDAGEAEKIFEKFYRIGDEMRRRNQGVGLGLYLVRRFTELSGGEVSAESAGPGMGAIFRVSWPAAAPAQVEGRA